MGPNCKNMPSVIATMCETWSNRTINHNNCLGMTFLGRLAFKMYFFIFQVRIVTSAICAKYQTQCISRLYFMKP